MGKLRRETIPQAMLPAWLLRSCASLPTLGCPATWSHLHHFEDMVVLPVLRHFRGDEVRGSSRVHVSDCLPFPSNRVARTPGCASSVRASAGACPGSTGPSISERIAVGSPSPGQRGPRRASAQNPRTSRGATAQGLQDARGDHSASTSGCPEGP